MISAIGMIAGITSSLRLSLISILSITALPVLVSITGGILSCPCTEEASALALVLVLAVGEAGAVVLAGTIHSLR